MLPLFVFAANKLRKKQILGRASIAPHYNRVSMPISNIVSENYLFRVGKKCFTVIQRQDCTVQDETFWHLPFQIVSRLEAVVSEGLVNVHVTFMHQQYEVMTSLSGNCAGHGRSPDAVAA